MKLTFRNSSLSLAAVALSIAGASSLAHGAVTVSSLAPVIDGGDQGKVGSGDSQNFTKSFNSGGSDVGQSFTTSTNVGGYSMTSLSFKSNVGQTGIVDATFSVRIIKITDTGNPSSYTTVATDAGHTFSGSFSANDWFTWTLNTPVTLDAETLYGVDIRVTSTGTGTTFSAPMKAGSAGYADGRFFDPGWGALPSATINHASTEDMMFHVNLAAIPEPSAALLGGLGMLALLRRRRSA